MPNLNHEYQVGDRVRIIPHLHGSCGYPECRSFNNNMGLLVGQVLTIENMNSTSFRLEDEDNWAWSPCMFEPAEVKPRRIKKVLTIGSDPELAILDKTILEVKNGASEIFNGCGNTSAGFGTDGASATLELRPRYSRDPLIHARNIGRLLKSGVTSHPNIFKFDLMASSPTTPIGGHIHFGGSWVQGYQSQIGKHLDYLLALPFMVLEIPSEAKTRKCNYGSLSDIRTQEWGIEYRTLPSFLASRELTEATLCIAYAVVHDVVFHDLNLESDTPFMDDDNRSRFTAHEIKPLKPYISEALSRLTQLSLYSKYKTQIDWFISKVEAGKPLLQTEVKKGWGIATPPQFEVKPQGLSDVFGEAIKNIGKVRPHSNDNHLHFNFSQANTSRVARKVIGILDRYAKPQGPSIYLWGLNQTKGNLISVNYSNLSDLVKLRPELVKKWVDVISQKHNIKKTRLMYCKLDTKVINHLFEVRGLSLAGWGFSTPSRLSIGLSSLWLEKHPHACIEFVLTLYFYLYRKAYTPKTRNEWGEIQEKNTARLHLTRILKKQA